MNQGFQRELNRLPAMQTVLLFTMEQANSSYATGPEEKQAKTICFTQTDYTIQISKNMYLHTDEPRTSLTTQGICTMHAYSCTVWNERF